MHSLLTRFSTKGTDGVSAAKAFQTTENSLGFVALRAAK